MKISYMISGIVQVANIFHRHRNSTLEQKLLGWGWNEHGNMGLGHTEDVMTPILIPIPTLSIPSAAVEIDPPKIVGIWAGCGTSWFALESQI